MSSEGGLRKPLRSMKLSDETWSTLGNYAKAQGSDRTKIIEWLVETYIPQKYKPSRDLPLGQSNIWDFVDGSE